MDITTFLIIGRLTKDVEIRYTTSGKSVGQLSIASNSGYGDKKEVSYFEITKWEPDKIQAFLLKGLQLAITGTIKQNRFVDKNGVKQYKIQFVADNIQFLGGKQNVNEESEIS